MRMFLSIILIFQFNHLLIINGNRLPLSTSVSNCTFKYGDRILSESETIKIGKKIYKVENCRLERAYQTCRQTLWHMLYVVCSAIDDRKKTLFSQRQRRFVVEKLLTEACCQQACTVSEMTGFCPN